jgi:hypothetical protein
VKTLPTFLKPLPTALTPFPAILSGALISFLPAPKGFISVLKNPIITFPNNKIGANISPDEDEDETENEHIISNGIILAAIFVPLLYSTEKKVHKSIRHK